MKVGGSTFEVASYAVKDAETIRIIGRNRIVIKNEAVSKFAS
jgi:hypothetical protein